MAEVLDYNGLSYYDQKSKERIKQITDTKIDSVKIGETEYKSGTTVTLPVYTKDEVDTTFGADIALNIDTSTYKMTLDLKDKKGNVLTSKEIDFPIESMVINAAYADGTLTLTLQNGTTLPIDISAIISGLVPDTRKIAGIDLKDDITVTELRESLNIPDEVTASIITTTDRTLLKSHAGGLKVNRVDGESQQKQYDGISLLNVADFTIDAGTNNYAFKSIDVSSVLKPNTKYIVRFESDYASGITLALMDKTISSGIALNVVMNRNGKTSWYVFTTGSDLTNWYYMLIYAGSGGSTAGNKINYSNFMLAETNVDTLINFEPFVGNQSSPNPSYKQDIKSVVVEEIKGVGKNLFNINGEVNTHNTGSVIQRNTVANGVLTSGTNRDTGSGTGQMIKTEIGKTYIASATIVSLGTGSMATLLITKKGKDNIKYTDNSTIGKRISVKYTAESTDTLVEFSTRSGTGAQFKDIQFEEVASDVSAPTEYEPYHEKSIQLSKPIILRGKDTLDMENRKIMQRVYVDKVNDSTNITKHSSSTSDYLVVYFSATRKDIVDYNVQSTHFSPISDSKLGITSGLYFYKNGTNVTIHISIPTSIASDVTALKTWMINNNVEFYYVISSPIETDLPIADQIALHQLETFDAVTYIFTDSEIEPIIEVEYGTSVVGAYAIKGMNDAEVEKLLSEKYATKTDIEMIPDMVSDIAIHHQTLGYTKKNLYKHTAQNQTINGVSFTVANNGVITANGTATNDVYYNIGNFTPEPNKSYIFTSNSGLFSDFWNAYSYLSNIDGNATWHADNPLNNYSMGLKTTTNTIIRNQIYIKKGITVTNLKFYPMIRSADIIDSTYEPYVDDIDTRLKATVPIERGGTGKTTATDAANMFINALTPGSDTPVDADYYISQFAGGGTTSTTYHRRPVSALWNYIKSKADSVYLGKTATAANASRLSNTSTIGSATKPVYFNANGVPVAGTYTLGAACAKGVDTTVTSGSANLVTSGAVYTAIGNVNALLDTI